MYVHVYVNISHAYLYVVVHVCILKYVHIRILCSTTEVYSALVQFRNIQQAAAAKQVRGKYFCLFKSHTLKYVTECD